MFHFHTFSDVRKESKFGVFSGPYFPVFGLNTEIYGVNLSIQSKYGKIRTRKIPYLDTFRAMWSCDVFREHRNGTWLK